jgi:hypothetical protein
MAKANWQFSMDYANHKAMESLNQQKISLMSLLLMKRANLMYSL